MDGKVTGGSALMAGGTFVKLTTPLVNTFALPNSELMTTSRAPIYMGSTRIRILLPPRVMDGDPARYRQERQWQVITSSLTPNLPSSLSRQ